MTNRERRPRTISPGHIYFDFALARGVTIDKPREAAPCTLALWKGLTRFLGHPQLELSNNLAEASMRPIALGSSRHCHFLHLYHAMCRVRSFWSLPHSVGSDPASELLKTGIVGSSWRGGSDGRMHRAVCDCPATNQAARFGRCVASKCLDSLAWYRIRMRELRLGLIAIVVPASLVLAAIAHVEGAHQF